jgi:hypothetical protein
MTKNFKSLILAASLLAALFLAGCSVKTTKDSAGKEKDVDIRTPFGSLSVQKGSSDIKDTGLPLYPGSHPRKDDDGDHNANVNISSSMFGLKVVAQKYNTDDAPEKVLAFYQKQMGKFGNVIECSKGLDINFHHHDMDAPVTCEGSGHDYDKALKAGTENNQHIVAVKSGDKGTTFAIVYVRAWDSKDTI